MPKHIDAVEVVRCVDCDVPHNSWTGCPNLNGMIPPPDFYCARGQRKQQTDGATDMNVGNKSEKLMPCPFCGGTVEIFPNFQKQYGINCHTCGMTVFMGGDCYDKQKTTEKWNERAGT